MIQTLKYWDQIYTLVKFPTGPTTAQLHRSAIRHPLSLSLSLIFCNFWSRQWRSRWPAFVHRSENFAGKLEMERHVQRFLYKISFAFITIATFTLLVLVIRTPRTCVPPTASSDHLRFPRSTCDSSARSYVPLEKKNRRLWSTGNFRSQVSSYSDFFRSLRSIGLLHNHSRVLCVSAGAGHEVMALSEIGVSDVTGVELVDSPPLVSRADPHNLPFFDDAFDLAFSAHFSEALFPWRFAAEMERTVRRGGACVVAVEECGDEEVGDTVSLFRNSRLLGVQNVTLISLRMTRITMRVKVASWYLHLQFLDFLFQIMLLAIIWHCFLCASLDDVDDYNYAGESRLCLRTWNSWQQEANRAVLLTGFSFPDILCLLW